ncbi:SGNH/GDSL hydrolase family protein [Staphylococcus xylosus]|uniref:SGNH/GDSL hydrolase family protein n=1 Tax=Staphylococcus xylosus TaxID=1288 RepID=UPI002DB83A71|nr:SGNH/GDSL hydrolase family protein [Staphylococcus xylosus]MEB6244671.1 phage tail protein [Staphylococcus xylosus]MEB7766086.1 phage tail protein [Staphylococcus xylosus]
MPIIINSIAGRSFPLFVNTTTQEKVSEESLLSFDITEDSYNYDLVTSISTMWTVTNVGGTDDINEYKIIYIKKSSIGENQKVYVKAIKREIFDLKAKRIHESYTGSFTGEEYFKLIFKGSGYNYKLLSKVYASRLENLGEGDSRLELFKKGLKRYNLEYYYDEKTRTFYLQTSVGKEAKYRIDTKINANNVQLEEDASERFTYIKGFGDFDENDSYMEGVLQITYVHPVAKVIGEIHAPPVIDGRIKHEDKLKEKMEKIINDSIKISVSTDFIHLESYKEAKPLPGDITVLKDSVNNINDEVRIVEITTKRDVNNNIINQDVTLGDFTLTERNKKMARKAAKYVSNLDVSSTETPGKKERLRNRDMNRSIKAINNLVEQNTPKPTKSGKSIKTKNGTMTVDFTPISSIRNVKSIYVIGDSVAKGSGAKENFGQMLGKKIKAKVTNSSVGGATMSTNRPNSIYEQALKIKNTDLIIVQGTDDDWLFQGGIAIGEDEKDLKTYYGAFYQAVTAIKNNNPNCKIVSMTPTRQCPVANNKIRRRDTDKNKLNLVLKDYVNAQVEACTELDIPVFDAYRFNSIDPYNPAYRAKNMPDGLHPNELAHEVIMYELIKNYHYFYD